MENTLLSGSAPIQKILTQTQLSAAIGGLRELVDTRLDAMDKAQSLFDQNLNRVPTDVDKVVTHLKELHHTKFEAIEASIGNRLLAVTERLMGMDKGVELLQASTNLFMPRVDEKISALEELHAEKFGSIQTQFRERDVRTEQSSKDSKVAVDAALQAAKEAVGEQNKSSALAISKSEAATTKQIDQMSQGITAGNKAIDDKIDDLKERMTRFEGAGQGGVRAEEGAERVAHTLARSQEERRGQSTLHIALLMALVAMLSIGVAIWTATRTPAAPQVIYMQKP